MLILFIFLPERFGVHRTQGGMIMHDELMMVSEDVQALSTENAHTSEHVTNEQFEALWEDVCKENGYNPYCADMIVDARKAHKIN